MGSCTIIIPAFNEDAGIVMVLDELVELQARHPELAILVVDDGSTDRTSEVVSGYSTVGLAKHRTNKGYGAALKTGIRQAESETVMFCDADGQHRLEDVENLLAMRDEYDMVVGTRSADSHVQMNRVLGKAVLAWVANYLAGERIPDINSGLRVIKRELMLKYLHLLPETFSASTTTTMVFLKRSHDVHWTPIQTRRRVGKSSVSQIRHGSYTLFLILRIITLFNPMKVFFPVSVVLAIVGVTWGLIYLPQGGPLGGLSVFAATLLMGSIIVFMFGVLCDQVSQMRLEKYE